MEVKVLGIKERFNAPRPSLVFHDERTWLNTIWNALDQEQYTDDEWSDICTAMAWIHQVLGVKQEDID